VPLFQPDAEPSLVPNRIEAHVYRVDPSRFLYFGYFLFLVQKLQEFTLQKPIQNT